MRSEKLLLVLFLVLFAAVVLASAWISDDAYITFRSIDNWLSGYGLRWNVAERVQSYTHPLWMLTVAGAYAGTGELYWTPLAISIVFSVSAVAVLGFAVARSTTTALLALTPLILSKAFVDYSTSGLENPLTHLLLAIFYWLYFTRKGRENPTFALALVAALLCVNRLDSILLVLPALALHLADHHAREDWKALTLGMIPLFAWEIFSLTYYGFLLPNTAYAKLATGIPAATMVIQGLHYFVDSLTRDPITLATVMAGLLTLTWKPDIDRSALGFGIVAYLAYIAWVGGDFMSGRLFSAPLFLAAILIARCPAAPALAAGVAWVAMLVIGLSGVASPLTSGPGYGTETEKSDPRQHGIADERAFYYPSTGLFPRWRGTGHVDDHEFARQGARAREKAAGGAAGQALGLYGFYAGPGVHILDVVALSDPLLSRLEARPGNWRIGHFTRRIPRGYPETLHDGTNRIEDQNLASYYESIVLVTRAPLFSGARWKEILRLNLGLGDERLQDYERATPKRRVP